MTITEKVKVAKSLISEIVQSRDSYNDLSVGVAVSKSKRISDNKKALAVLATIKEENRLPTDEEKKQLIKYTGQGGLGTGSKDEYYTPEYIANSAIELLGDINQSDTILEPSCGTGVFLRALDGKATLKGIEINNTTALISKLTTSQDTEVDNLSFEEASSSITAKTVDGVITNVPFAQRKASSFAEDKTGRYENIKRLEHYFIIRSLELLKGGKRAVFIVPSSISSAPSYREIRQQILSLASFVGGIKLPNKVFSETGANVCTDILVFEKHPDSVTRKISAGIYENNSYKNVILGEKIHKQFINGAYFKENKNQVIGKYYTPDEFKQTKYYNGHNNGDQCLTLDSIEDIKKKIKQKTAVEFKNKIDYSKLIEKPDMEQSQGDATQAGNSENLIKPVHIAINNILNSNDITGQDIDSLYVALNEATMQQEYIPDVISAMSRNSVLLYPLYFYSHVKSYGNASIFFRSITPESLASGISIVLNNRGNISSFRKAIDGKIGEFSAVFDLLADKNTSKKVKHLDDGNFSKIADDWTRDAFSKLRLETTYLWNTESGQPHLIDQAKIVDSMSLIDSKNIDMSQYESDENGVVTLEAKLFTSDEILQSDDLVLYNNGVARLGDILYSGVKQSTIKAYLNSLQYSDNYNLSQEQFEEKRKQTESLMSLYIDDIDIDSIEINQFNAHKLLPSRVHGILQSIKAEELSKIENSLFLIATKKNIEVVAPEHIVTNRPILSSMFSKSIYNSKSAEKLFDKHEDEIIKALKSIEFIGAEKIDELISSARANKFGKFLFDLGSLYHESKDKKQVIFAKLLPVFHKYNERILARYSAKLAIRIKNNKALRAALIDAQEQSKVVKINPALKSSKLSYLSSVVNESIIESNHGYQNSDVNNYSDSLSGLFGHDVGMGKTRIITLTALAAIFKRKAKRAMIVVPTSLIDKWELSVSKGDKDKDGNWIIEPIVKDIFADKIVYITNKNKQDWSKLYSNTTIKLVIITADAFKSLSFKEETIRMLEGDTQKDIDSNAGKLEHKSLIPHFSNNDWKIARKSRNSIGYFENSGVDFLLVDEGHDAKNAVSGGMQFKFASSLKASMIGNRLSIVSAIIKNKHGANRGTIVATATPFTSSPYEIFTMCKNTGGLDDVETLDDFKDVFFKTRETYVDSIIYEGVQVKASVFEGLTNVKMLKDIGMHGFAVRTPESVGNTAIQPDEERVPVEIEPPGSFKAVKSKISSQFEDAKAVIKLYEEYGEDDLKENSVFKEFNEDYGLDPLDKNDLIKIKSMASTFSVIDKLNKLSISSDLANGKMEFNLSNVPAKVINDMMKDILAKNVKEKRVQSVINPKTGSYEDVIKHVDVSLKDMHKESRMISGLVPDGVDSEYYQYSDERPVLTVPVTDESILKVVMKYLSQYSDTVDINSFPKYQKLIENIEIELSKNNNAKQLVFSLSLIGARYIKHFIESKFKGVVGKIMTTVDLDKKTQDDDSGLGVKAKFQQDYNAITGQSAILVFTKAFTKGVDFNIMTAAIHLLDVPYTPDIIKQAIGRGIRQGNKIGAVSVYQYIQDGTTDVFKRMLLSEKSQWQEKLLTTSENSIESLSVDGEALMAKVVAKHGVNFKVEQFNEMLQEEQEKIKSIYDEEVKAIEDSILESVNDSYKIAKMPSYSKHDHLFKLYISIDKNHYFRYFKDLSDKGLFVENAHAKVQFSPSDYQSVIFDFKKISSNDIFNTVKRLTVSSIYNELDDKHFSSENIDEAEEIVKSVIDGQRNKIAVSVDNTLRTMSEYYKDNNEELYSVIEAERKRYSETIESALISAEDTVNELLYSEDAFLNTLSQLEVSGGDKYKGIKDKLLNGEVFIDDDGSIASTDDYYIKYKPTKEAAQKHANFSSTDVVFEVEPDVFISNPFRNDLIILSKDEVVKPESILEFEYIPKARLSRAVELYQEKRDKLATFSNEYFDGGEIAIENYNGKIPSYSEAVIVSEAVGFDLLIPTAFYLKEDFYGYSGTSIVMIKDSRLYISTKYLNKFDIYNAFKERRSVTELNIAVLRLYRVSSITDKMITVFDDRGDINQSSDFSIFNTSDGYVLKKYFDLIQDAVSKGYEFSFKDLVSSDGKALAIDIEKTKLFLAKSKLESSLNQDGDSLDDFEKEVSGLSFTEINSMYNAMGSLEEKWLFFVKLATVFQDYADIVDILNSGESNLLDVPSWISEPVSVVLSSDTLRIDVQGYKFDRDLLPRSKRWGDYGITFAKGEMINGATLGDDWREKHTYLSLSGENYWSLDLSYASKILKLLKK